MSLKSLSIALLFFLPFISFSQDDYSVLTIPGNLTSSANAVIRSNEVVVSLESAKKMTVEVRRIITVLNKEGNKHVDAYAHYDNNIKIKGLSAIVFDANGNQIKKIRKNDFVDVSAVDGGTLYSDSRVKYLGYTPVDYPYTIVFTSEIETDNTAFIQPFNPLEGYYVSIESSSYTLNSVDGITIRKKEVNFGDLNIEKEETLNRIFYKTSNLKALKPEDHSPSFHDIMPKVLFASKQFALTGEEAEAESWSDFGKWIYEDLVKDAYDLSPETISLIQNLVKDEPSNIEKAKKIYQYVQNKTRYISVQVGIGGWKPFNASEVDELGYGDCKALTNYTMSLLKAANIESNYTVLYAGKNQRNIDEDFVSMQGNHVILSVPSEEGDLWLECTSQKLPFGFIGDFTDDRDVLVITPEGGKIKHTKKYEIEESTQVIKGTCQLTTGGSIVAKAKVISEGIQYDNKYQLESETARDLDLHYKKRWKYINNLAIDNIQIDNDKEVIKFNETIDFKADNYSKVVGNRMLLNVNVLNRNTYVPNRYRNRTLPVKVHRGFRDVDEVEIKLPEGYKVESLPKITNIENQFGIYKAEVTEKEGGVLVYKRTLQMNDGEFPKEDYEAFRDFYKAVTKQDNHKIALIKI